MTDLDFSCCRLPPFQHQREDVEWLMDRPYSLIASEMRTGKTKIIIDAAQFLHRAGIIDRVLVVAPAPVRDVWYDPQLGELKKHLWENQAHHKIYEFHSKIRLWKFGVEQPNPLEWWITNFEFLRSKTRVQQLLPVCGHKTWLVLDESSFVKNHAAEQTKSCVILRNRCGRITELNGTPIFHSPLDLFSQANLLHPSILQCPYITLFKARYAIQSPVLGYGGKPVKKVVGKGKFTKEIVIQQIDGWTNLEDIQKRLAPYTVRRLQKDCLDLPPKLDPVTLTATLDESWPHYKNMRDELVVWLQNDRVATSATAAVKVMRLSQITSGFLGGIEDANIDSVEEDLFETIDLPGSFLHGVRPTSEGKEALQLQHRHFQDVVDATAVEVGREKLNVLLWFIEQQLEADPNLHLVAWTRHRAELFRAVEEVKKKFPQFIVGKILGSQRRQERLEALALLKPETSPTGPVFVAGVEGTGSFGLDMTAAHTCVTMSCGYSPGRAAQTLDRVYGPNQKHPIAYFNIVAVGPKGQRTIDHDILLARMNGEEVATRTAAAWISKLKDEE